MTDRADIEAMIPVDIKLGTSGLYFVTSPLIKGLLVSDRTRADVLQRAREALQDLALAAREQQESV